MRWGDEPTFTTGDMRLLVALVVVTIALLVCVLFTLGAQL